MLLLNKHTTHDTGVRRGTIGKKQRGTEDRTGREGNSRTTRLPSVERGRSALGKAEPDRGKYPSLINERQMKCTVKSPSYCLTEGSRHPAITAIKTAIPTWFILYDPSLTAMVASSSHSNRTRLACLREWERREYKSKEKKKKKRERISPRRRFSRSGSNHAHNLVSADFLFAR